MNRVREAFEQGYKDAQHPFGCPSRPSYQRLEYEKAWERGVDQYYAEKEYELRQQANSDK